MGWSSGCPTARSSGARFPGPHTDPGLERARQRFHPLHLEGSMTASKKDLRRINQNIPSSLYERLEQAARREDRTKSAIVVRALEAYLGRSSDPHEESTGDDKGRAPLPHSNNAGRDER